jgi:hypothetical protein
MQFTLLSRFQGVLLGALVGEGWAVRPGGFRCRSETTQLVLPLSRLMLHYAKVLAQSGDPASDLPQPPLVATLTTSEAAIGLLPVALFWHEADGQIAPQLQRITATWPSQNLDVTGLMLVARAIALLLREQLTPIELIPGLLQTDFPDPWRMALQHIQVHSEQATGLAALRLTLQDVLEVEAMTIALAFYCFLSTPTSFELAIRRAEQLAISTSTPATSTLALVGALSGAYNSWNGIPIAWRLAAGQIPSAIAANLLELAQRLLTTWSGVYNPQDDLTPALAIAAPQVIRQVRGVKGEG